VDAVVVAGQVLAIGSRTLRAGYFMKAMRTNTWIAEDARYNKDIREPMSQVR
jgi:hypothetical protein